MLGMTRKTGNDALDAIRRATLVLDYEGREIEKTDARKRVREGCAVLIQPDRTCVMVLSSRETED